MISTFDRLEILKQGEGGLSLAAFKKDLCEITAVPALQSSHSFSEA